MIETDAEIKAHPNTDELFYVISGNFTMKLREYDNKGNDNGMEDVHMGPGDVLVVPRGMRHCPAADEGDMPSVMMVEMKGTLNVGDAEGEDARQLRTEPEDVR